MQMKKPHTEVIVITDNQITPQHQTVSDSSINGLSEGAMFSQKPNAVSHNQIEEVKVPLAKKNSVIQNIVSAHQFSSMNEGAENF